MKMGFMMCAIGFFIFFESITCHSSSTAVSDESLCRQYSDSFETFDFERWQEVLIYSKIQGTVTVDNEKLILKAPTNVPCEIQVYSLFALDGDFDIQTDYDVSSFDYTTGCIFNAGLVLQTEDDENSYKCYISMKKPKDGLIYRARLDYRGETRIEQFRLKDAAPKGTIRIVREKGIISFLILHSTEWKTIYTFKKQSSERLRIRFKFQTRTEENVKENCHEPAIFYDNFQVNSCTHIVVD
jgi:hypothetical protein